MARILVVDDQYEARAVLEAMLQPAGYEVVCAASGLEALKSYRSAAADLVIVDLFMPEMDGFETMAALRKEFPEAKIMATSGNPLAQPMLAVARRLGAIEVLQKPFTVEQLLALVTKCL